MLHLPKLRGATWTPRPPSPATWTTIRGPARTTRATTKTASTRPRPTTRTRSPPSSSAAYLLRAVEAPPTSGGKCYTLGWVDDKQLREEIRRRMPEQWLFMTDYFYALERRLELEDATRVDSHGVRIGRDGEDDWWIKVHITSSKPGSDEDWDDMLFDSRSMKKWDFLAMKQERRYRMIRESMILQSMMAEIDYNAWLHCLLHVSGFKPPNFMHLNPERQGSEKTKLPRRFSISFAPTSELRFYEWTPFMKDIFNPKKWTNGFTSTYCKMYRLMTSKGFDMSKMKPIPVKLRFAPQHCGYLRQLNILKIWTHLVAKIKKVEERWRKRPHWRDCPKLYAPPIIYLESIDLDLREFTIYPSVLNAVEKFIATAGVRIELLTLPGRVFDGFYEEGQLRSAWASLLCTTLGIQDYKQGSRARTSTLPGIDRLVIPSFFMYGLYNVPFFMAARDARGVKSVRVEMDSLLEPWRRYFDKTLACMIGYAFFDQNSKSSVLSLDIDGAVFTERGVNAMRTVLADGSLQRLYFQLTGLRTTQSGSEGQTITVKQGTSVTPCWKVAATKVPAPWTAKVVRDDPAEDKISAYLPGFGLCDIQRSDLPSKKRRKVKGSTDQPCIAACTSAAASIPIRSLSMRLLSDNDDVDDANDWALHPTILTHRLSLIFGDTLEELKIISDETSDETVHNIFSNFKNLRSLSLIEASASLQNVVESFHRGTKVSSLDLNECIIDDDEVAPFFQAIATEPAIRQTLRRLRIGRFSDPTLFTQSTVSALVGVLKANKSLTLLHILVPEVSSMWDAVNAYQGEVLPNGPLQLRHRLAFASVVHHTIHSQVRLNSSLGTLDQFSMRRIFEFAAPTIKRTVIIEAPPPPPPPQDEVYRCNYEFDD